MKYKYIGESKISINGVGVVNPDDVVETEIEINHPLFIESKKKEAKVKDYQSNPKGVKDE